MEKWFNKIAIVGVGFMGGSLALALKKKKVCKEIFGIGRNINKLKQAKKQGIIDSYSLSFDNNLKECEIIFITNFPSVVVPTFKRILPYIGPTSIITDISSVKENILKQIEQIFYKKYKKKAYYKIPFIGGHPLVGSEKRGFLNAKVDLYENAPVILTPTKHTDCNKKNIIKQIWQRIGAYTIEMSPSEHDYIIGILSHLPHIFAYILIDNLNLISFHKLKKIIPPSFKELTRIASSNPLLWKEIFIDNKAMNRILDRTINRLRKIKLLISDKKQTKIEGYLKKIESVRKRLV